MLRIQGVLPVALVAAALTLVGIVAPVAAQQSDERENYGDCVSAVATGSMVLDDQTTARGFTEITGPLEGRGKATGLDDKARTTCGNFPPPPPPGRSKTGTEAGPQN